MYFKKLSLTAPALSFLLALGSVGCSSNDDSTEDTAAQAAVVKNYAENVRANYVDALETGEDLNAAVKAFVKAPSADTLEEAKHAWLHSRDPYGLSEAFRFYQGPIDNDDADDEIADGPEGLLNSWPLDEAYIDYVTEGKEVVNGGIINDAKNFPKLDAETLSQANAAETETTISTGYHAIEFLLWGQDHSLTGPGDRPYTDYVAGDEGTAENQARRAEYLTTVTQLLVDDLSEVNDAWAPDEANYRADFEKMAPRDALGKIMLGMGSLAGGELSHERMRVAYDNKDQEDEHSCFSDNTLADLRNNATSVQNVLLGRYAKLKGPGIADLVEAKNAKLADELRDGIQTAIDEIEAVEGRFDVVIAEEDGSDDRKHLLAAITALDTFRENLGKAAEAINVPLQFEE